MFKSVLAALLLSTSSLVHADFRSSWPTKTPNEVKDRAETEVAEAKAVLNHLAAVPVCGYGIAGTSAASSLRYTLGLLKASTYYQEIIVSAPTSPDANTLCVTVTFKLVR